MTQWLNAFRNAMSGPTYWKNCAKCCDVLYTYQDGTKVVKKERETMTM